MSIEGLSINGVVHQYVYDSLEGEPSLNISFKTRPGYINSAGNQEGPGSDTQEVYTNKIPCYPGDTLIIKLDWNGYTGSKWVAYAVFDRDGRFISRTVFSGWNSNATAATFTTSALPENSYYIAFSYRTYGDCTVNITYPGSMFDIRNRYDKGLLYADIGGEWDTIHGVESESITNGVCRLGWCPITGFIHVAGKKIFIEKNASYTSGLVANIQYFDGDKNYLSPSGWLTLNTSATPPTGAVYARVMFDASGNPATASGTPIVETVRENTKIYTKQSIDEPLTPIILGYNTNLYYPEWDTVNNTFKIPNDCIFFKNGQHYLPSALSGVGGNATVLNIPVDGSSAMRLYFNLNTNVYEWIPYNTNTSVDAEKLILVAAFRINKPGTYFKPGLSISCPYKIDGKLYGVDTTANVDLSTIVWAFGENVKGVNHRGYNTVAPENTLPAYKLSKQNGFKYVECDVSMTSDRVPVLLHDDTINRTARNADGTTISETINITSITYEQALTYDFGIWKSSTYAGTKIPTFEQFILLCRNLGLHPYIELKSGGDYTEAEIQGLVDIVDKYGMSGKVSWISFSSQLLHYVKNYDTKARIGYVVGSATSTNVDTANSLKTNDNEVFLDVSSITDELAETCAAADIPVEVWTVNSTSGITGLNPYVSGVTSDNLIAAKVLYEANI